MSERGKNPKPKGADSPHWTGGVSVNPDGYVKVAVGREHPLADPNGYAYMHLLVWMAAGNPRPAAGFILHHVNEHRDDNRLENLELLTRAEHNALHNAERGRDPATGLLLRGRTWDEVPS
jgi:hypothetical protein